MPRMLFLALPCMVTVPGVAVGQDVASPQFSAAGDHDTAMAGNCPPPDRGSPEDIGRWERLNDLTELMVVHGAMLHTGKVLMFSGELEGNLPHLSFVWDPLTNEQTVIEPEMEDDIFCSGHTQLADGRILVNGGDWPDRNHTNVFDPVTETWDKKADMAIGRWYPTTLTLADGRVITFSGWDTSFQIVDKHEVWDPKTEQWSFLPSSADRTFQIYPSMHLLPNGKIVYTGTRWNGGQGWGGATTAVLDMTTNTWQIIGPHIIGDRSEGHSVLLPELEPGAEPWRIMVVGGNAGGNQQETAEIIDMSDANPAWAMTASMTHGRNNANGAILADGKIAMVTGIDGFKWGDRVDAFETEVFDPVSETWKVMDAMEVPGQYHSVGLLLPDGRVLKTGGHDGPGVNIHDMEVYLPPYMFQPRPVIDSAPAEMGWGQQFTVNTPESGEIIRVALIKLGQITHHTNPDQRYLALGFEETGAGELTVTAPAHGNLAPPGYYYLSVVNECDVPSESVIIHVGEGEGGGECSWDLDSDNIVGTGDLILLLGSWGDPYGTADLIELLGAWGPCP